MGDATKQAVFLTKSAIASNGKKTFAPVELPVPEWGGSVFVRKLAVDDVPAYNAAVKKVEGTDNHRIAILTQALVDEAGACHFGPESAEDRAVIAGLDLGGAERVVDKFLELNGLARKN
ncbi:hypothetical protein [Fimbriiglobus ruber]|uniref:Uncharacterized protein n=1 Tax=Fimbriiglobus ruber TaxID=1908690 RepID=A0A225DAY1_9BACT|nr:hypothetical protein [Fimbriiglobus ruber]OWK35698.1 hypothetical protein FRUB_08261 [Fimbriiglobus ruber]